MGKLIGSLLCIGSVIGFVVIDPLSVVLGVILIVAGLIGLAMLIWA